MCICIYICVHITLSFFVLVRPKDDKKASQRLRKKTTPTKDGSTGAARDGDLSIEEGREICKAMGSFKVGIHPRPKMRDGGWEVYVKHTTGQKWSKASSATVKIGDGSLRATILHANEIMLELYENHQRANIAHVGQKEAKENAEQPDCRHDGKQDEANEEPQEPKTKRRRKRKKTNAPDEVRDLS